MRLPSLLTVLAVVALFAVIQPVEAANLGDEIQGLLANHPQLAAASSLVSAAKAGEVEAQSGFLPRFNLYADGGYEETERRGPADLSSDRYSFTTETAWNLFDGYASTSRRDSAELSTAIAEQSQRRVRQAVMLEASTAYLDVMRQLDLLRLSKANETAIKRQLDLEDERVRRGSGIAVDVLLAKSRLQVSKERLTQVSQRLFDAESRYGQVFGHAPNSGALQAPVPPRRLLPSDLQAAVAAQPSENPAVLGGRHQVDRADAARREAHSGYYPSVDLVTRSNWEHDVDGVKGKRVDWAVLARLRWELFSGFETRARVARAAEEYSAAMSNARQVERKSEEALALAWHELDSAARRLELLSNAVVIAAEVWGARKRLRDAGKESALNVLDAENELLAACINFVNADFDNRVSVYRVLFQMGRLEAEALTGASPAGQGLAAAAPDSARACGIVGNR